MKIKYYSTALIVLVILFGGYGIFKVVGLWDDVSDKAPTTIVNSDGSSIYDPSSIRGSSKFIELSEWFNIPLEDLGNAFNVPSDLWETFANKDLEVLYSDLDVELGNGSVKLFVALYTGLPYEIEEETYLPTQAVNLLTDKANLSSEQVEYINKYKLDLPENLTVNLSEKEETDSEIPVEVKGKTTFKEVIDAGVEKEVIEEILGLDIPSVNAIIRDFCIDNELEFSYVKESLTEEMNK